MIEHREIDAWAEQLGEAGDDAYDEAKKVVAKGALNIKKGARDRVDGIAYAPHYPAAITYDPLDEADGPAAEIGPDKELRQGALGNIFEYGAPAQNTPPRPHIAPAADEEMPRFEKELGDLGVSLLEEGR
ncbi:hypothetical protein [Micromonospora sp. NPDC047730]|uniref:hypothetical protein n=1 Tax=Micromonospora sp. NPDC047730 TaxID=3364253 RepID=UPI00370FC91C